jgi:hypothetical protein
MNLSDLKVPELREKAHALEIEDADKLKKAELIEAIEKAEAGKKSLLEKAKDAVNNLIHPDQAAQKVAESQSEPDSKGSSSEKSDYEMHPKFAKFNRVRR